MININGKSFQGNNLSIINGKVIIDGKEVGTDDAKQITIVVEGNIENLEVDYCESVQVKGDVNSATFTSGNLTCQNVRGGIQMTSGNVKVSGDVAGNIKATSGNIKCGKVSGDVSTTSGKVTHSLI